MNYYELLDVVGYLGKLMLENGAETYRVEDSIERLALAYGISRIDVYAASTSIMITITTPDDKSLTRIKRIKSRSTNLDKIERLNRLCRSACTTKPDVALIKRTLIAIRLRPDYSLKVQMFGYGLTTWSFCLFFGGSHLDALCALAIGPATRLTSHFLSRLETNVFFTTILSSSVISLMGLLFFNLQWTQRLDLVIIGAIMPLVPGVALTNSIRDLMAGDFVAGQARLMEAVLTATCIALGVGIPLSLFT